MANHVSSLKRARQAERKTAVNRANKSRVRGSLRTMREALAANEPAKLADALKTITSALDKSVQKGILHKNTASRYKSRLAARVKAAATAKPVEVTAVKAKPAKKAAAKKTAKA